MYLKFCDKYKVKPVPISHTNLGRYIAYLSYHLSFRSIRNYLSVVRWLHLEAGMPNPSDCHYVSSIVKGTKRTLGDAVNQKLPITPTLLLGILKKINLQSAKDITFWAACLVAFFSFFRKSNLLAPSLQLFNPDKHLSRDNITFSSKGAVIKVKWSKTIQFQERELLIPLPHIPNSPLCPSCALFLSLNRFKPNNKVASAFMYRMGGTTHLLSYNDFLSRLRECLHLLGLDPSKYTGHSFRRGGASFALECGVPNDLIQVQGDWRSLAYQRYLDPSLTYRQKVADTLGSTIAERYSREAA